MTGKTHVAAGVASAVVAAAMLHVTMTPAIVVLGGIGGLAPDLDHPEALLTRHLLGVRQASGIARETGFLRHRGFAHSVVALVLSTWLLLPLVGGLMAHGTLALGVLVGHAGWTLALWHLWGPGKRIGWAAGFASHMVVDALNTKGVQWFWPINLWIKSPIPNITVGTWPEDVFRWVMFLGIAVWAVRLGHPLWAVMVIAASEGIYRIVKI